MSRLLSFFFLSGVMFVLHVLFMVFYRLACFITEDALYVFSREIIATLILSHATPTAYIDLKIRKLLIQILNRPIPIKKTSSKQFRFQFLVGSVSSDS